MRRLFLKPRRVRVHSTTRRRTNQRRDGLRELKTRGGRVTAKLGVLAKKLRPAEPLERGEAPELIDEMLVVGDCVVSDRSCHRAKRYVQSRRMTN